MMIEKYTQDIFVQKYKVIINGRKFFYQSVKNDTWTLDNIQKIDIGQIYDYTTGCLLDYPYFKKYYKMIAIDLIKQQALDVNTKAMQQINFTGHADQDGNIAMFFIIEKTKETIFGFS